jgi:hypothetical protein
MDHKNPTTKPHYNEVLSNAYASRKILKTMTCPVLLKERMEDRWIPKKILIYRVFIVQAYQTSGELVSMLSQDRLWEPPHKLNFIHSVIT